MLNDLLIRLRALFHRKAVENELDEELRYHFDREVEKLMQSGLSAAESRRHAQIAFGGTEQIKTECREARGVNLIESLFLDFRYGIRTLGKNPGFATVAVITLALGIGTVTAMFSTLWAVALRPLPFDRPGRLVWIEATTNTGQRNSLSAMDYFDYRERSTVFESLAARCIWEPGKVIGGSGEPERVSGAKVSGNFFHTLGVEPMYGRSFVAGEEVAGGPNAVMVSYGYWQQRLGAKPEVIGAELTVDGSAYTIAGVMPRDFDYPTGASLWFPMRRGGDEESGRGNNNFAIIGRLADGVNLEQAQTQMNALAARIAKENPQSKAGWGIALTPLHEQFFGNVRPLMMMLMGAAALLLLIACGNLSSLTLARVLSRKDELALRLSLGATSWRVCRQLLIESLILTISGASVGLLFAWVLIQAVKAAAPGNLPRIDSIQMDEFAMLVTVTATAVAMLLAGLVPAWRGSRLNPASNLLCTGRSTEGQRHLTLRQFLVAGQISLSLMLLIAMGLLLRSANRLQSVDTGMQPNHLLTLNVQSANSEASPEQIEQNYELMLERIRALPGVTRAAGADQLPFFGGPWNWVYRGDRPPQSSADQIPATRRMVTEDFFETMGIPLIAGRGFDRTDSARSRLVVVISRSLARRLYPNGDAVGKMLGFNAPLEIVGVAGDVRDFGLAADLRPAFYLLLRQQHAPPSSMRLVIRSGGSPDVLVPAVRSAIREIDRGTPLYQIGTMDKWISNSTSRQQFSSFVVSAFAVLAVVLATVGLFGLMSYAVAQRTHEFGIRMALGAKPGNILRLLLGQGLMLATGGIGAGLVAALASTRFMRSLLYQISPMDPIVFLLVPLLLMLVSLLASYIPARRATKVNPVVALRYE